MSVMDVGLVHTATSTASAATICQAGRGSTADMAGTADIEVAMAVVMAAVTTIITVASAAATMAVITVAITIMAVAVTITTDWSRYEIAKQLIHRDRALYGHGLRLASPKPDCFGTAVSGNGLGAAVSQSRAASHRLHEVLRAPMDCSSTEIVARKPIGEAHMKTLKILGATAAILVGSLGLASTAQAYDGCGWGYHMNRWGECRPNFRHSGYGYYRPRPVVYVGGWGGGWGHHHHHHHHGFGGFGFRRW